MLNYFSSRAIRRLVVNTVGQSTSAFPALLWQVAFQGKCAQWVGTHAEKILAAVASCSDTAMKDALNQEMQPILKRSVADWAIEFVSKGKALGRVAGKKEGKSKKQLQKSTA